MLTRRKFFSALACSPVTAWAFSKERISTPLAVDLSITAIEWALLMGKQKNLGAPLVLRVGAENEFIAREILWSEKKPYRPAPETTANPLYRCVDYQVKTSLGRAWEIEFESGIVHSEGCS